MLLGKLSELELASFVTDMYMEYVAYGLRFINVYVFRLMGMSGDVSYRKASVL